LPIHQELFKASNQVEATVSLGDLLPTYLKTAGIDYDNKKFDDVNYNLLLRDLMKKLYDRKKVPGEFKNQANSKDTAYIKNKMRNKLPDYLKSVGSKFSYTEKNGKLEWKNMTLMFLLNLKRI
jgi:arylsulfatase A-like enzyme